ncbi:MAG: winged helix-turn-helix transcriptional regulator [Rhizobiaceae bacterium]|nr:winged helix-turn-helix transcriptional regulator [Rhizobiaceae bacterium]
METRPAEPPAAIAAKLAALSHPARLQILRHLSASGSCCCGDVVDRLDLAQSTVSQHLKVLVEAGLVRYSPDRQRSRYAIDRDAVGALAISFVGFMQGCCAPARAGEDDHGR